MAEEEAKMTPEMRYYYRNREEKIAKDLARYHNNPEVIAKKEERERKRIEKGAMKQSEKEAEKEVKRIEKERIRQEKLVLAESTKRRFKEKSGGGLDSLLAESSPAEINS
jgi:hypothetical protein